MLNLLRNFLVMLAPEHSHGLNTFVVIYLGVQDSQLPSPSRDQVLVLRLKREYRIALLNHTCTCSGGHPRPTPPRRLVLQQQQQEQRCKTRITCLCTYWIFHTAIISKVVATIVENYLYDSVLLILYNMQVDMHLPLNSLTNPDVDSSAAWFYEE